MEFNCDTVASVFRFWFSDSPFLWLVRVPGPNLALQPFMRSPIRTLCLAPLALLAGCGSSNMCTADLRTAVRVHISSPDGLPVSAVTVSNHGEQPCETFASADASSDLEYDCYEQGGGIYTVHVESGSMTWTKSVSIAADSCHVTEQKTLEFVLDPATAD